MSKYQKESKNSNSRRGIHHGFDDFIDRAFGDEFFSDPFDNFDDFGGFGGFGNKKYKKQLGSGENKQERDHYNNHDLDIFEHFGNFGGMGMGNGGFSSVIQRFNSMGPGSHGGNGTVISKSYVSTVNYDKNGKPIKKEYTSQGIDTYDKNGTKISEKQSGYKDEEKGIKKECHQRLLNDVGHKIVKTRDYINKEEREDNFFKGMREGKILII